MHFKYKEQLYFAALNIVFVKVKLRWFVHDRIAERAILHLNHQVKKNKTKQNKNVILKTHAFNKQ